jgi:hypothetical protein
MSMARDKGPILYHFEPANPGESLVSHGIPARDLTEADRDRLEPAQQRQALAKGPSGEPMYHKLSREERAEEKRRVEAAAAKAAEAAERKAADEAKRQKPAGGDA